MDYLIKNSLVRNLIQDKKNTEILTLLNINKNINHDVLKEIFEYSVVCNNYELVKLLWFSYDVKITIYEIIKETHKNPYDRFLNFCLKNKIVSKKKIYVCNETAHINLISIGLSQMNFITIPQSYKIYIFNATTIKSVNFIKMFEKFIFSNSHIIITHLDGHDYYFNNLSNYLELHFCYSYSECLNRINRENFKNFLKVPLKNENYNIVFYNLKYYIEEFL